MGPSGDVLLKGGALIAGVLVLGASMLAARWLYRKWLKDEPPEAFALRDLEAMRDAGQVSPEEFSRLRRSMMGLGRSAEKGKSLSSDPGKLDDGTSSAADVSPRKL